jgi:MEDS: MEthanogen/methylotroph, DcmR Sensory domain
MPDFRHEALLYAGADDFAARAVPVIAGALGAGEPVLVAVDRAKIDLLRDHLGAAASSVRWMDIRGIGHNPARIIPIWRRFVADSGGRPALGLGEPVWAGRTPAGLEEAQRHEHLLNLAFAGAGGFTLLCPYDTEALERAVVDQARHSHPAAPGLDATAALQGALPEAPAGLAELLIDGMAHSGIRGFVADQAIGTSLRLDDLAMAVTALEDSLGWAGTRLRVWLEDGTVLAQVDDLRPVADPLAGREWPAPAGETRGLWLANQLCDLVRLRSSDTASTVRLSIRG